MGLSSTSNMRSLPLKDNFRSKTEAGLSGSKNKSIISLHYCGNWGWDFSGLHKNSIYWVDWRKEPRCSKKGWVLHQWITIVFKYISSYFQAYLYFSKDDFYWVTLHTKAKALKVLIQRLIFDKLLSRKVCFHPNWQKALAKQSIFHSTRKYINKMTDDAMIWRSHK